MKWITRAHVHVDRVACPWLISRFVDSGAEFMFVSESLVLKTADECGAMPFDVAGVELGHRDGLCSFESIMRKHGLNDPALLRLARVIHCADIESDIDSDPISRGLEAIATGFGTRTTPRISRINLKSTTHSMPGAVCR